MLIQSHYRTPLLWLSLAAAAFAGGVYCGGVWTRPGDAVIAGTEPVPGRRGGEGAAPQRAPIRPGDAPQARLAAALSAPDFPGRAAGLRALAQSLAAHDGAGAWSMYPQIAGAADREEFCVEVLRHWSEGDPEAAWEAALALPAGRLRTACASAALQGWARVAPGEAVAMASRALTGQARENAVSAVMRAWAEGEAPAAAAWAIENVSSPGAAGALSAVLESWADSSPAAASQWVAGLPPGESFTAAATALVGSWGRQYPLEAATWLVSQAGQRSVDGPAAELAAEWAASEPAAATEWAATLGRSLTARDAASRAVGEWAAVAPLEAAAWLAGKAPEIPAIAPALHDSLAASWAAHDPAGAANWLNALGDRFVQADAATPVFNTWAATDAAGLAEWIALHPQSPVADEARAQLALTQSDVSPADAISVALQLTEQEEAADLGRRILDDWRVRDLVAADNWMEANPQAAEFIEPLE